MDYNERPILVFWEVTRACPLRCRHCRAEAILNPLPGELETDEAISFIDSLTGFGEPYPVLIFTGGDPLMRDDIDKLICYAIERGFRIGLAPSISDKLDPSRIGALREIGVKFISISLDGAEPDTHDSIRGIEGHFQDTINKLSLFREKGFITQVNTVVTPDNVFELPHMVRLLHGLGIRIWEVFFLIQVGRGVDVRDLEPHEYEDVIHFLYEVTRYGFEVRTVEAPFYRRVVIWRREDDYDSSNFDIDYVASKYGLGSLYRRLATELIGLMGEPVREPSPKIAYTRDGKGVIFVAYNGDVYPSGFAPLVLGNVRESSLVSIYRENRVLKAIRMGEFRGRCGYCEFRDVCGGSRARAYMSSGDILGEDPACIYVPASTG